MIITQCQKCKNYIFKHQSKIIDLETLKSGKLAREKIVWCLECLKNFPKLDLKGKEVRLEKD